jgi:hypothetical protein
LQGSGDVVVRLVCRVCAGRALAIVPMLRSTVCGQCRDHDASVCGGCANDNAHRAVRTALQPFAERLRQLAKAYRLNADPRHEGLDMAADILDAARN